MNSILITGIGGDIAQGVATIIRSHLPGSRLYGADMHEQHGGRLFVDELLTLPPANDPEYAASVRSMLESRKIGVFLPMSEPELGASSALLAELGPTRSISSGTEIIAAGLDKLATITALRNLGLPVPWTIPVTEEAPPEYPCILKDRFGSGSRAVFIVRNEDEAHYLATRYPNAVYQELLEPADREVTCAVYRSREGRVATLLMLRRLTGGFTGWAQVIENEEAANMCHSIAKGLDLRGSMNIQLRLTEQGPRVFEINPRFSSTALMRHRAGFTDVVWALEEAQGNTVEFTAIPTGTVMVRTQGAAVINNRITGAFV